MTTQEVQVSVEVADGLQRRLKVNVPSRRLEQEVETRLRSVGRTAVIRGYRPGKAPEQVIRQRYGEQVWQDVVQEVLQSTYAEAVNRENLRPAANPQIQAESVARGQDLVYTAVIEVFPEFQLQGLDSLRVHRPSQLGDAGAQDDDVNFVIDNLRRQRAHWHAVHRPAKDGDRVLCDFTSTLDGKPMDGGKGDNVAVVIGAGRMVADFERNLLGIAANETRTFQVTFPTDYHAREIAGRQAEFTEHLPAADAEFIRSFGVESGEMADFRSDVLENIGVEFAGRARADVKRQLLEQLLEANPIAVPSVLMDQEAGVLQSEAMRNLGVTEPSLAPARDTFRPAAERRVRLGLLIGAVIRDHKLTPDAEKVRQKIDQLVQGYEKPDEIRRIYLQNQQLLGQVENSVLEEQVVDWLAARATEAAKPMSFRDLVTG
jgi:trigger factor